MARSGIYKSEVIRARSTLLTQGIHPSIDAIRLELGNTGSKTTIHRYLKEIEEEDQLSRSGKVSVSDAILNMVDSLSVKLHEEANVRISDVTEQYKTTLNQKQLELTAAQQAIDSLKETLVSTHSLLTEEKAARAEISKELSTETLERTRLHQQVIDLQDRLAEEAVLRQSLEEKHRHARESLEHFRGATKDQRDQEQRRHEQQVQQLQSELRQANQTLQIKQNEITQLNSDNARLATELGTLRKQGQNSEDTCQRLSEKLKAIDKDLAVKTARLNDTSDLLAREQEALVQQKQAVLETVQTIKALEIQLAAANTELTVKNAWIAQAGLNPS